MLLELGVNNKRQQWNHVTTKAVFLALPCIHGLDNYALAQTAETRPFLLLRLFGLGNKAKLTIADGMHKESDVNGVGVRQDVFGLMKWDVDSIGMYLA